MLAESKKVTDQTAAINEAMQQTLVIDKWSTSCGNCGFGGYLRPPYAKTEPTKCLNCEVEWTSSVASYETGEDDQALKARMEQLFEGLEFIGFGYGSLRLENAQIYRRISTT